MFQMKFEDVSADIAMNNHQDDESADFFNFFTQEPKNNLNKTKEQQWGDFFNETNNGLPFKKEESFNEKNNQIEYLNNEDCCFFYNQQEAMECENDYKLFNREFYYPNMQLNHNFSSWKQESKMFSSKGILVDQQVLQNERKVSSISWNKLKNYIEVQYNINEQYLIEKKSSQKQACSDSQIETIEPSVHNSDAQSVKNLENSATEQEEFLNSSNDSSQVNMTELSLNHHLDQSQPVNFNEQLDYQNQLISSDFFIFRESGSSQKIAFLSGSFISQDLLQLLSDKLGDIQNIYSSQQLQDSFASFKNEANTLKKKQIQEYIFSNMESFSSGQVTCEELFAFETVDAFQFTAQVFFQVFHVRGLNGDLQGCVIKHHLFVPQETIAFIQQQRKDKQQKEKLQQAEQEEEQQQSSVKSITKEQQIMKDIQNCKRNDQFSKQVKKFLYKFKYISKQKNQKKQKREQDLYPSKTCKYRLIKQ
ncbi:hypothetical protein TTHERM_00446360 (macronuclear) [Tetrahymena thermophila SB210]|uniref:Uncharacterized protein n=1 Tax=Tetrahymena thermophila (strain SB210) TaxID=312017 RepID=I7M3H4_TETTS|nr:hypothetical protein TTHERM_00446360 [Tetrahymena thermophila SB210]EAS03154.2 hypothetical protein TTHERM_00446360 [Tetrahymena thermophila SB210]|eukprot:XP_001023399.2 hypothetical protein TTHERM_00446360 [Tetrahymena thermophila SB210]